MLPPLSPYDSAADVGGGDTLFLLDLPTPLFRTASRLPSILKSGQVQNTSATNLTVIFGCFFL
jgi:hypothetical protein